MMNYEIATHLSGARNDKWGVITRHSPLCLCEADEVSRSNLGGDMRLPRFAGNDNKNKGPAIAKKESGDRLTEWG